VPGFLHAAILYGLAGVSIPILIHFFARPRIKQIVFSSIAFLKSVERRKASRMKLRKWLLLFLRTAAVACLVLAFARPVIRSGRNIPKGRQGGASAWIVDPSLSMMREGVWSRTQRDADALAGQMEPDERAALLWTVPSPESEADTLLSGPKLARAVRNRIPCWQRGETPSALAQAARLLTRKPGPNPEMVLFGDLQASGFAGNAEPTALRKWKGTLFVLPSKGGMENVAVTDAGIESSMLKADKPLRIRATVRNFGEEGVKDRLVRFFLNGQAVAQKTVSLKPGESRTESVPVMQEATGWLWGKVLYEADRFPQDDERFFCAFVPGTIHVLLAGKSRSDLTFFEYALQPGTEIQAGFDVKIRTANQDWSALLGGADALFLSNLPRFTSGDVSACRTFLENGGGIFYAPGGDADFANLNDALLIPLWGDSLRVRASAGEASGFLSLGAWDVEHPLFRGVFERGRKPVQSPRFYRSVELTGKAHRTIVPFSSGFPFLSELRFGKGTFLFMSAGVLPEWSDLATSPFFPALVVRSAVTLSAPRFGNAGQAAAGDSLAADLKPASSPGRCQAGLPSGERISLVPSLKNGRLRTVLSRADAPGIYRFFADDSLVGMFAVNPDPAESDFRQVSRETLSRLCPSAEVVFLDSREPVEKQIRAHRIGRELWRELLALGLLLLLAESLVGALWK
jgi:hypothetical protein